MARPRGRALVEQRRRKAEEAAAVQATAQRRRSLSIVAGGAVVGAAAIAFLLLQPPSPGRAYESLGNQHLSHPGDAHIPYNSSPPSSGPHWGGLADWGESVEPIPPEVFIHNLEDAGVVLAYDCQGCERLVSELREVVARHEGRRLLLTPYSGISDESGTHRRGAAVAWGRVLYFDELEADAAAELDTFIDLFEGVDHHVRTGGGFGHG